MLFPDSISQPYGYPLGKNVMIFQALNSKCLAPFFDSTSHFLLLSQMEKLILTTTFESVSEGTYPNNTLQSVIIPCKVWLITIIS